MMKHCIILSEFKGDVSILVFVDIIERVFQLFKAHSVMKNATFSKQDQLIASSFVYFFFNYSRKVCLLPIRKKKILVDFCDQSLCICIAALCPCSFAFKLPIFFFFFFFFPKFLIPRQFYSEMAIFPAFLQNYTIYIE